MAPQADQRHWLWFGLVHERGVEPYVPVFDKSARSDGAFERKKVEMLFAHLKRIMRLDRLRLRGPNGARDEFHLAAAAQNLRKLARISLARQAAMA